LIARRPGVRVDLYAPPAAPVGWIDGGHRAGPIHVDEQREDTSLKTTLTRPWSGLGVSAVAALTAALIISAGCDSTSFVPPPPPQSNTARDSGFPAASAGPRNAATSPVTAAGKPEGKRAGGGARVVELILARPADSDREYLALALRRDLGRVRTIFRVTKPESGAAFSPGEQADAIRTAVGRGVAGLVVEPSEEPAVVDALYDAVGRGVAVLLLDRPVPARGGKTIPRVEFTGFAEVGRQIVEDLLEADRSLKRTDPGRAVILHHRSDDPYIDRSLDSLLGPCKASGKPMEVVNFEGMTENATEALWTLLKADPKLDIVLADDTFGVLAAYHLLAEQTQAGRREFLLGGYTPYDTRTPEMLERAKAFGDRSVETYALKTTQAIVNLLDGRPAGDVIEVPVKFHRRSKIFVPRTEGTAAPSSAQGDPTDHP
jgi:ABC-type sugar transport system substrate-binding protein